MNTERPDHEDTVAEGAQAATEAGGTAEKTSEKETSGERREKGAAKGAAAEAGGAAGTTAEQEPSSEKASGEEVPAGKADVTPEAAVPEKPSADGTPAAEEPSAAKKPSASEKLSEAVDGPEAPAVDEKPPAPEATGKGDPLEGAPSEPPSAERKPEVPLQEAPADEPGPAEPLALHALSPAPEDTPPRRRSPFLIASIAAAAVLLIGSGTALVAANTHSGAGGDDKASSGAPSKNPPLLALDGYTPVSTSGSGGNGIAPGEPNPYGTTYQASGTLPQGPSTAPVYWAKGQVDEAEVTALAKALGVEGTPVVSGTDWTVGTTKDGSSPVLRVNRTAPGTWTYSRYSPGSDDCVGRTICGKEPLTTGTPIGADAAKKAAAPVLKAIGEDDAKVDATQTLGAQRLVSADPVVGDLPTDGWTTALAIDTQGDIVSGNGQLTAPAKGATYPVLGANETLALLNAAQTGQARMGIGGCAAPVPLKDRLEEPCGHSSAEPKAASSVVKISSAAFGLASHTVKGQQVLVPSWLFSVDASTPYTVNYPAVDPKYLTDASTPAPSASSHDVKVDSYTAEGNDITVRFTGGVCADYSVSAKETDDQVTVTVTATPWQGKVCVMIAKVYEKTVELKQPLGERKVVGDDGNVIPVLRAGSRVEQPVQPQ